MVDSLSMVIVMTSWRVVTPGGAMMTWRQRRDDWRVFILSQKFT